MQQCYTLCSWCLVMLKKENKRRATCRSTSGRSLSSLCWQSGGRTEKVCLLMIARRLVFTRIESGVSTSILHLVRFICPEIQNKKDESSGAKKNPVLQLTS